MSPEIDLSFDETQAALADAVERMCRDHCTLDDVRASAGRFPEAQWRALAELGALATGGEGAGEAVAVMETLGRALFPGPLHATLLALELLPAAEHAAIVAGDAVVSIGSQGLWPFAERASVFLELDGSAIFRVEAPRSFEAAPTLGGEPWGRADAQRIEPLPLAPRALALHDAALAAYLAAAGRRMIDDAAEHARTRRQFGRVIGEFQAVAHPLADCVMSLDAAGTLARAAAAAISAARSDARSLAAAARASAIRSSLEAAYTAHQVFGAIGATLEGPAYVASRRIRQLASTPVGADDAGAAALAHFEPHAVGAA